MMKRVYLMVAAGICACGVWAQPEGFKPLFNGSDLSGWWGLGTEDPAKWKALPAEELAAKKQASLDDIHAHWRVEDGILINDGHGLYLTTEKEFGDFELMLEYRTQARADSGIYLRGIPQVQIWDYTDPEKFDRGSDKGSGGLWNNKKNLRGKYPLVLADKPFGEWNRVRILMIGERVTVHLNGQLVVDHARMDNYFHPGEPLPRTGPIQLQTHGGEISWRNVWIREIGAEEANQVLAARCGIDGRTPAEWMGAVGNYLFEDGLIQCRPDQGGTIYSSEIYGDFAARMEIRIPPGGNNGLAIRYPGHGDGAYAGMCELQVLDNTWPEYAELDSRQYHGSAYGMVAAHRGYQRPPGQWNFQTVEVRGPTVTVELNGTVILEADLSTVAEFMGDKPHPGKDLSRGHFGFAGHKSPVAYRNLSIMELNNGTDTPDLP